MEPLEDRNLCSTIFTNLRALRRPTSLVFGPDHNLYVASSANHAILRYDGQNGHMLPAPNQTGATFVASVRGTIGDMTFGPDGNLYVSAFNANRVFSYDAASGVLLGAIGGAELRGPTGLAFAADGTLCVSSFRNNQVLRYDAPAGTFLGTLIANGKGGPLAGPRDLAFAADGALCVASSTNNRILRYDGTTGAFLDILSKSVRAPRGMSFETDGNLYIGSNKSGVIVRYTYVSGPGAIPIVAVKLRNVGSTRDFTFGVDGNLYVVNSANNRIRRIDAATGKMLSFFGQTVNRTNVYIDHLDIHRFEINGSDYLNPAYSPLRLGKSEAQLNRVYDYDFRRLYHVEYFLTGVNRPSVLRYIFNQVTAGAANDTERQLRILTFLQKAGNHNLIQPMYPDRTMVEDPLVLLELGEMRCGHVARLAVDLFAAAGYRGRLVFLYQHEIAEIRYGMRWHYLDADVFGGGQVALDPDGSIPSVAELSKRPYRIDAPDGPYQEPNFRNQIDLGSIIYPSYYYFSNNNPRFAYVYKTSSYVAENSSRYYGWENIQIVTASDIRMSYRRPYYLPGAPNLQGVTMTPTPQGQLQVSVSWSASIDKDHDLLGYRVFVSRQSRGWNYGNTDQPLKSSTQPWRPDMYDARFSLPPSDVALLTVGTTTVTFVLDNAADYFVSVMPFDAHGEVAGRTLYPVSEEIRIPNWTVTNNVRAPCKGVVLQWVQLPPGNCCSSQ